MNITAADIKRRWNTFSQIKKWNEKFFFEQRKRKPLMELDWEMSLIELEAKEIIKDLKLKEYQDSVHENLYRYQRPKDIEAINEILLNQ